MSGDSAIEWTDATWSLSYGCDKVSPACAHCYIERSIPYRMRGLAFEKGRIPVQIFPERLDWPFRWKKPKRVFVESLGDIFHEEIPDEFLERVFEVMAKTPAHTYQVLTKRADRMYRFVSGIRGAGWPLPNVWLGVTAENQHWADERIPILMETPAAVRFVSYEPALGPVDLLNLRDGTYDALTGCGDRERLGDWEDTPTLDWVIIGGESGPRYRPFDLQWARAVIAQCHFASKGRIDGKGTSVFVKQLGGNRPGTRLEDLPEDLRIREFPR